MSLRKRLDNHLLESKSEVQNMYLNPNSVLKCDECSSHLGLIRMVLRAFRKSKGDSYEVVCKKCGHVNKRVKGKAYEEIRERWDE